MYTRGPLPRLFQPFVQADSSLDRPRGGLGLGLAVSRSLIALHGGTMEARSEGLGHGTTVSFTLPLAPPMALPARPAAEAVTAGGAPRAVDGPRRILLVEDNRDAAEMLGELLSLEGFEVLHAPDGHSGVERARAMRPDVVICDLGLPKLNGYEVARSLRAAAETCDTLLIALTGYGQDDSRERSLSSGFDLHLTKPFDPLKLKVLLSQPRAPRSAGGP